MPSIKPRMLLTLPEDCNAAIGELALALGKPKATLVTEFLVDASPNFRELARVARHFKLSPTGGISDMAETVNRMAQGLAQAQLGLDAAITPTTKPTPSGKARPSSSYMTPRKSKKR